MFHLIDPRKKNNNPPPPEVMDIIKDHSNYHTLIKEGKTVQIHICNVCCAYRPTIELEYDGHNQVQIGEFSPCPKCNNILSQVGPIMDTVNKMISFQLRILEKRLTNRKDTA